MDLAKIEPPAVQVTMLPRLLSAQHHPPLYGGVVGPYCHMANPVSQPTQPAQGSTGHQRPHSQRPARLSPSWSTLPCNVVDAASFRHGIYQLCPPTCLCTAAEYQQLHERVKQLLLLVHETANFNWFWASLSAPLVGPTTVLLAPPPPTALSTQTPPDADGQTASASGVSPLGSPIAAFDRHCTQHGTYRKPSRRQPRGQDSRAHADPRNPCIRLTLG